MFSGAGPDGIYLRQTPRQRQRTVLHGIEVCHHDMVQREGEEAAEGRYLGRSAPPI